MHNMAAQSVEQLRLAFIKTRIKNKWGDIFVQGAPYFEIS